MPEFCNTPENMTLAFRLSVQDLFLIIVIISLKAHRFLALARVPSTFSDVEPETSEETLLFQMPYYSQFSG